MAKLKGPLFSLGASQQLGKALVFFNWKGLNVVREFVVPANPNTTNQQTQRGYLTRCVSQIHTMQGLALAPLVEIDIVAYALWASVVQAATTWFNQACRNWLDQKVAGKIPVLWYGCFLTPAANNIQMKITGTPDAGNYTNAVVWWGTSKTALIHSQAVTKAQLDAGVAITGMVTATKYYLQVRTSLPGTMLGSWSGIYHDTTT